RDRCIGTQRGLRAVLRVPLRRLRRQPDGRKIATLGFTCGLLLCRTLCGARAHPLFDLRDAAIELGELGAGREVETAHQRAQTAVDLLLDRGAKALGASLEIFS